MQARIERPPTTFDVHVYLFDHSAEGTIVYNLDGTEREVVSSGAVPEPSFQCDEQILRALVAAGSAPSSAMSRHLNDATDVRDRLLSLVENAAAAGGGSQ